MSSTLLSASATSPRRNSPRPWPVVCGWPASQRRGRHSLNVHDGWIAANAEPFGIAPADVRTASTFVRRFELGLLAPDALRIPACQRLGSILFTFDERQAMAAERLGVRRASMSLAGV